MPIKNYQQRLDSLNNRRRDDQLNKSYLSESFGQTALPQTVRYVFEAMQPIEASYTAKTYTEAERVKNQIQANLQQGVAVTFDHQGSVPLNTHIRLHSDLDILVIHGNFEDLQNPQVPQFPYQGIPNDDLRSLRRNIHQTLTQRFPQAVVDNSKGKCMSISKGSLQRKFDIIVGNWYNTNEYARTLQKKDRGLFIYDNNTNKRVADYPFSHMHKVDMKAITVYNDNYRRLIRLLKNLKMDADVTITLSSFMITSVLFHMNETDFMIPDPNSTRLLINASRHLERVINDTTYRLGLHSPNQTELLFTEKDAEKVAALRKLKRELDDTIADLGEELLSRPQYFHDTSTWGMNAQDALEKANIYYKR